MHVRTDYAPFLQRVKMYLDALLSQLVDLQFTRGGPIIAAQVNELNKKKLKCVPSIDFPR